MLRERGYTPAQIAAVLEYAEETYYDDSAYEFSDTLRIAREDNDAERAEYEEIERGGCCGSHDAEIEVVEPDGSKSTILFGFNYGH